MKKITEKELLDIIIVHTARTWERIRIKTKFEEMPLDNIRSVDAILEIADEIIKDSVLQKFLTHSDDNWDWEVETCGISFSDSYIEYLAEKIIQKDYRINLVVK